MHHYFDHKNNSGSEIIKISSVENQTHINIIRDRKSIGRHQIPLFFKLYGSGLDLDKFAENPSLSLQIAKLVRSPFCLKCMLIGKPTQNRSSLQEFNQTEHTYLLSLDFNRVNSGSDYLKTLNSKVRNQINRSLRKELSFIEAKNEYDIGRYISLRNKSRIQNNLRPLSEEVLIAQIKELEHSTRIFLVLCGDQPVCGQIVQQGINIFTLTGVCTSRFAYEMKLNANEFMQFNIINLAINERVKYIDWGGAQPNTLNKKIQSIDNFKKKWGGELVELPCIKKGYR